MKKAIVLSLLLGGLMMAVPSIEARSLASASAASDPQIRVQIGGNHRRGRNVRYVRSRIVTRIVRQGRFSYRETLRITTMPNGQTRTQVISRQRINRY